MNKAENWKICPMKMGDLAPLIERTYRQAKPFQWLREGIVNAIEAKAKRISLEVEPEGIAKVFRSETQFSLIIFRTQLFDAADIDNVKKVQAGYKVQTLSQFQGKPPPPAAPTDDVEEAAEAAEERARGELGMIRNAEVFVQILPPEGKPPESKVSDAKPSGASSAAASRPSDAKPSAAATKPPAPPAKPPVKPPPKPVAKPAPSMNSTPPAGTQPAQ